MTLPSSVIAGIVRDMLMEKLKEKSFAVGED